MRVAKVALTIFLLLCLLVPEDILDLGVEGRVAVFRANMVAGLEGSEAGLFLVQMVLGVVVAG